MYRLWRSKEKLVVELLSHVAAEVEPLDLERHLARLVDMPDCAAAHLRLPLPHIGSLRKQPT